MSLQMNFVFEFAKLCFKNSGSIQEDCIVVESRGPATTFTGVVSSSGLSASHFNAQLPDINSSSMCSVDVKIDLPSMPSMVSPHQFSALALIDYPNFWYKMNISKTVCGRENFK